MQRTGKGYRRTKNTQSVKGLDPMSALYLDAAGDTSRKQTKTEDEKCAQKGDDVFARFKQNRHFVNMSVRVKEGERESKSQCPSTNRPVQWREKKNGEKQNGERRSKSNPAPKHVLAHNQARSSSTRAHSSR